jgi:hypothetical protein
MPSPDPTPMSPHDGHDACLIASRIVMFSILSRSFSFLSCEFSLRSCCACTGRHRRRRFRNRRRRTSQAQTLETDGADEQKLLL